MTTNDSAPFPVEVPGPYIKDKDIDYDLEIYAAMGASLPVGGFLVRSPSLGVFSLLETYESPFIAHPEKCSVLEFWRVLYINEFREKCLQDVMEWAPSGKEGLVKADNQDTWQTFDWAVFDWGKEIDMVHEEFMSEAFSKVCQWFNMSFEGFDMVPSAGGSSSSYWFGADSIGSLVATTGMSLEKVLWEMPMCSVGHVVASICKQNGNNNVARKKDPEDVKLKCDEARERILNGEMHPWQLKDPENWPLTSRQAEYNPKLIDQWEALVKEKRENGRR